MATITFQADPILRNVSYMPPGWPFTYTFAGAAGQRYAMYYPRTPQVGDRFPVMLFLHLTNFGTSTDAFSNATPGTIGPATGSIHQWMLKGGAVMSAQVTAPNKNGGGGQNELVGQGRGYYFPPGRSDRAFERPDWPQCFKDAVHAMQHLRFNSRRLRIDPERICVAGNSSGAHLACYLALSPNRAMELGRGGQLNENTVPNAAYLFHVAIATWERYNGAAGQGIPPTLFYAGGVDTDVGAANLDAADAEHKRDTEWMRWIAGATNDHVPPIVCYTDTLPTSTNYHDENTWGDGTGAKATGAEIHDAWQFGVLKEMFPEKVRLHLTRDAVDAANVNLYTPPFLQSYGSIAGVTDDPTARYAFQSVATPRWDRKMPAGGIRRRSKVETVGRYIVPPNPVRRELFMQSDAAFEFGASLNECVTAVAADTPVRIPYGGQVFARSASGTAEIVSIES